VKKIVRILALTMVLAGTYSAAMSPVREAFGGGGPAPLCDPANPKCDVDPNW